MRTLKYLALFAFSATLLWSCSDDDDANPDPVNEEEVIVLDIFHYLHFLGVLVIFIPMLYGH